MNNRIRLAALSVTKEQRAAYQELWPLSLTIVRRNIERSIAIAGIELSPSAIIEAVNEGIAFAWQRYVELIVKAPSVRQAVIISARHGAAKASGGKRFCPGRRGYIDALDRRAADSSVALELLIDRGLVPIDVSLSYNDDEFEETVLLLPALLQPVARLLSQGLPRQSIADKLGVSLRTITTRCKAIKLELSPPEVDPYAVIGSALLECFACN